MASNNQLENQESRVTREIKQKDQPDYKDDEIQYLDGLIRMFENALSQRETPHVEFDGMNFSEYWQQNERLANTQIQPKKNKHDVNYQSGTARDKLLAVLSSLNNLNLSPDISAYDKNNIPIGNLGNAMETIIYKTENLDQDATKKLLRQYELLKQGTVFVEESWGERWMKDKKVMGNKRFTGKLTGLEWVTRLKKAFSRPTRNIINSLQVVLGSMSIYDIKDQPYIFTIEVRGYYETESIFGKWDRWKYVTKNFQAPSHITGEKVETHPIWNDVNIENGQCVIIRYQNKWDNEFAVLINGVLMTPIGLPLSSINGYNDYNITQQNLEPIRENFAYGKSMMSRIKTQVGMLDEFEKLAILKTQQSFAPPAINLTGRVVSSSIWMPGKMSTGIPEGGIKPIMDGIGMGVTASEFNMINKIKEDIDSSTVSPIFQGQNVKGDPTATQIVEMQRQAKIVLGLTIFSASMLEWKLGWLRLYNILAYWFEPENEELDEVRGVIRKRFRSAEMETAIEGEGMGLKMVVPTDKKLPKPEEVRDVEESIKERSGKPVRVLFVNPESVKNANLTWRITVRPREKTNNELSKLMFRAKMQDAQMFGDRLNLDYLAENFAQIWGDDPAKLFNKTREPMPPIEQPMSAATQQPRQQGQSMGGLQERQPRVNSRDVLQPNLGNTKQP